MITENSASFDVSIRLIVKANDTGLEHTIISLEKLVDMSDGLTLTTMPGSDCFKRSYYQAGRNIYHRSNTILAAF